MSIYSNRMAYCCAAVEIGGFGGGEEFDEEEDEDNTVYSLKRDVLKEIRVSKRLGVSVLVANTTSNQPNAIEVLSQLGFYTSAPFKIAGSSRKMQTWFLPLCEYKEK